MEVEMKRENSNRFLAAVLAGLFGLVVAYGSLSSSDFPCGLYGPPQIHSGDGHWSDFAALNPNRVWNYASQWHSFGDAGKDDYLDSLEEYNLKAILRNGDWKGNDTTGTYTDSIPYLVEHYSCGQHKELQAEMTYDEAADKFFNVDGTGFYHFKHYQGREGSPLNPGTWYLTPDSATAGNAMYGPHSTIDGPGNNHLNEPNFYWPGGYHYQSRAYQFRIRSKIDTTGYSVSSDTMVYQLIVTSHFLSGSSVDNTLICRVGDYSTNNNFEEHAIQITVTPSGSDKFSYFRYRIRYEDQVPLWIDWIEYMDKEQPYPLFANETLKAQTFAQIDNQCDSFEQDLQHGDEIIGWAQSDEPKMSTFDAHGIINDYMIGQNHRMPQLPFRLQGDFGPLGCKHFALVAKPRAFDFDIYPFLGPPNQIGDQTELDTLAEVLDLAYSPCGDSTALIFTA
jgi:hypothetical protein